MVRCGPFELTLVHPSGETLPEVEKDGQFYAVASPGHMFKARVTVHPHLHTPQMLMQGIYNTVSLKVDGIKVGYRKCIRATGTTDFPGFLASGGAQSCSYRSFVFSTPQATEAKKATSLQFVEGTVQAKVYYARDTSFHQEVRPQGQVATNETVAPLPEGKKFFLQPSLTTGQGALQAGPGFSTSTYQVLGPGSLATLLLRYETASTLLLRGVLRQDNPAHQAILQRFPETASREEQQPAAAAGRKLQRQQDAGGEEGGGQQQPARQRQRQGDPEKIDLTSKPNGNAADEILAARQRNQVLSCDLTGDDDAPQWSTVPRPVHSQH
ncbi:hypothetical protein COHA_003606 [Chlorella ohadii]|uniref:Uncharacterized protein n=1 Tax=Chlorella ohadii TaxID=2649997 RepID=A0AAD5H724_9CHLO|nr:hypothetical protein COHA_003606 [Chlorella ohadii]